MPHNIIKARIRACEECYPPDIADQHQVLRGPLPPIPTECLGLAKLYVYSGKRAWRMNGE
jgi:hypothetical protein